MFLYSVLLGSQSSFCPSFFNGSHPDVFALTYLLTYLLTNLLTPWCRVLLEKLTDSKQVKKFPAFHGTRRFITAFTSVRHLSLSWVSPFQSIHPHRTSWRSVLILSTHLRLVSSLGTINNKSFRQKRLVYYFIIIRVTTCFDPTGSSSGLHYEPVNYKTVWDPKNARSFIIS